MAHKSIHHIGKGLTIALEVLCFLAVIVLIAWGGLLWRLSQGPLDVAFLTGPLERAMTRNHPGFEFDAQSIMLTWGGRLEPFEIEMRGVDIHRTDKTPVVDIDRVGIQLSKRHLVIGSIAPKSIKIYTPTLGIIRWEDGSTTLNMETHVAEEAEAQVAPQSGNQIALIQSFLKEIQGGKALGFLGSLDEISVEDAKVSYEDKKMGIVLQSRMTDILFERESDGLSAHASLQLDMPGDVPAVVNAEVGYDWRTGVTRGNLSFSNITPAQFATQSAALTDIAQINLPLRGSIDFVLDRDFKPGATRFVLGADAGTFNAMDLYKEPLPITSLYLAGRANIAQKTGAITQFKMDLQGPVLEASGTMTVGEGASRIIAAQAVLVDTKMDNLGKYWSEKLAPDAQKWVTKYLTKGIADKATLELELGWTPPTVPEGDSKIDLRKVGGKIDFHGIQVDYYDPLTPVTNVSGSATYDEKSFHLNLTGGKLNDMTVTKSIIHITDLDKQDETHHAWIDISVDLNGPLKTALKVLDSEPLDYPKMLGIQSDDVAGRADLNVKFKFPLHDKLIIDDVEIGAKAKLEDVQLGNMVAGMPVSGGPMDLEVTNGALKVKGTGKLSDMPMNFDWIKNFDPKIEPSSEVKAQLPLTAAALEKFGVPKDFAIMGTIPADITYTQTHKNTAVLKAQGDITNAAFTLPVVDFRKETGKKGTLALNVALANDKITAISGLDLKADGVSFKGDITFDANADLKRAALTDVVFGGSQISLTATGQGAGGYMVDITGPLIDASAFFQSEEGKKKKTAAQKDAEAAVQSTPLKLNLNVARILTDKNKSLDQVRLSMQRNGWGRIDRLELGAQTAGAPFNVEYLPVASGHTLRVDAQNAGAALSALGLVKSVYGGKLSVNGKTGPKDGPRDMRGTAVLTDFVLKDAPVIARLVNAMSLPGILSLLSGEGMKFKKARVNFSWLDRGQPEQAKNVRTIKLWDGQTSGTSLGLTFEGTIDNWAGIYDLNGTIIPVSDINKMLKIIPILGDVLTAGGEGIIAATYTIKGPTEDPSVMVNPLSVLAPGILRKIFFE